MLDIETIRATLAQYGNKSVTSGFQITKDNLPTGILILFKKGRMRFEDVNTKQLYMSGPIKPETIESFVQGFWCWEKVKPC